MRKRYFLKLVRKHLNGKSTVEEEQLLLSYYNLFEAEPDVVALLSDEEKKEIKTQMSSAIWQGISKTDTSSQKIHWLKLSWIKIAAAILIGTTIAGAYFLRNPFRNEKQLANQQIISKNQNRLIHLPDGSTVIVIKGSKLVYSSVYNEAGKREVYLEGEAYFDVKHDATKPFIVHTGNLQTTVLGTAFNVKAIKGEDKIIVTVTRGKVSVGNKYKVFGMITPDQQIVFNKDKDESTIKRVDANTYLVWKNQDLLFDDVSMEEAAKLLKDRFNVNITFTDQKLLSNRFTTTFQHDESLEYILDIICEVNNVAYTYDKEHAEVTINNKTN
jgi:transmembrane sensor